MLLFPIQQFTLTPLPGLGSEGRALHTGRKTQNFIRKGTHSGHVWQALPLWITLRCTVLLAPLHCLPLHCLPLLCLPLHCPVGPTALLYSVGPIALPYPAITLSHCPVLLAPLHYPTLPLHCPIALLAPLPCPGPAWYYVTHGDSSQGRTCHGTVHYMKHNLG